MLDWGVDPCMNDNFMAFHLGSYLGGCKAECNYSVQNGCVVSIAINY